MTLKQFDIGADHIFKSRLWLLVTACVAKGVYSNSRLIRLIAKIMVACPKEIQPKVVRSMREKRVRATVNGGTGGRKNHHELFGHDILALGGRELFPGKSALEVPRFVVLKVEPAQRVELRLDFASYS